MLRYTDYDIVFREIPDETTLAVNLAGCPNRCPGCHSPQLQEPIGEPLTEEVVERLLARGVPDTATAMQAIGYKEIVQALRGQTTMDEAVRLIQQRSRNYAKRQLTWFRRNPELHWLEQTLPLDFSATFAQALLHIPFFAP